MKAMMATAQQPSSDDGVALLLEFLRERDVPCPRCGYNLRNLTSPQCPECRKDLTLAVGLLKPRFGWFLATVTPGLFSGIAAGLLSVPLLLVATLGGGLTPWPVLLADAFGFLSGIAALVLVRYRHAFLRQSQTHQIYWAISAWAVHLLAFFVVMGALTLL